MRVCQSSSSHKFQSLVFCELSPIEALHGSLRSQVVLYDTTWTFVTLSNDDDAV